MREKKKDSGGGGGKDVVAKTAEGAIKWVERDLEKWCRSYNFDKEEEEDERTKTTTTTKGRTKIDGNEVVERVLEEEFKPQPEELEASLKDAKKGGNLDDYFSAGLRRSTGRIERGSSSVTAASQGSDVIFKDYRESSGNGDGEGGDWEDMKANVEWAVGVVRNLREEGGGEVNGLSVLVRSSDDVTKTTYYHEEREVPEDVLDGLRNVIQAGVRMGIIENPGREWEMRGRFRSLVDNVERSLEGGGRGREEIDKNEEVLLWEGYADAAREAVERFKSNPSKMATLSMINVSAQKLYVRLSELQEMKDIQYMTVVRDVVKAGTEGEEGDEGARMRAMVANTGAGEEFLAWVTQKIQEEESSGGSCSEWCMVLKLVKAAVVEEAGRKVQHLVEVIGYANRFGDEMQRGRYLQAAFRDLGDREVEKVKELCGRIKMAAGKEEFKELRGDVDNIAWIEEFAEVSGAKRLEGRETREIEG